MKFSGCIEWLFADEAEDFVERVRLARTAGLDAVEFWRWSGKDIDAIRRAADETGLRITAVMAEPVVSLTDRQNKDAFLEGLRSSIDAARKLGAVMLIAQGGKTVPGRSGIEHADAIVDCLKDAARVLPGSGVRLAIEPLNTLIDHKDAFLSSTTEALSILNRVDAPDIGLLHDVYHSAVMGEDTASVLRGNMKRVFHIHLADHPGRQEPGMGSLEINRRLQWILAEGYREMIGLEYRPAQISSRSVPRVLELLSS